MSRLGRGNLEWRLQEDRESDTSAKLIFAVKKILDEGRSADGQHGTDHNGKNARRFDYD